MHILLQNPWLGLQGQQLIRQCHRYGRSSSEYNSLIVPEICQSIVNNLFCYQLLTTRTKEEDSNGDKAESKLETNKSNIETDNNRSRAVNKNSINKRNNVGAEFANSELSRKCSLLYRTFVHGKDQEMMIRRDGRKIRTHQMGLID